MRTREDIEYQLKRMDEEEKMRALMLKKINNYEKLIDSMNKGFTSISQSIERLSDLLIELPPDPPITDFRKK